MQRYIVEVSDLSDHLRFSVTHYHKDQQRYTQTPLKSKIAHKERLAHFLLILYYIFQIAL